MLNLESILNFIKYNAKIYISITFIGIGLFFFITLFDKATYTSKLSINLLSSKSPSISFYNLEDVFEFNFEQELFDILRSKDLNANTNGIFITNNFSTQSEKKENLKTITLTKSGSLNNSDANKELSDLYDSASQELQSKFTNTVEYRQKKKILRLENLINGLEAKIRILEQDFNNFVQGMVATLEEAKEISELSSASNFVSSENKDTLVNTPLSVLIQRFSNIRNDGNYQNTSFEFITYAEGNEIISKKLEQARNIDLNTLKIISPTYNRHNNKILSTKREIELINKNFENAYKIFHEVGINKTFVSMSSEKIYKFNRYITGIGILLSAIVISTLLGFLNVGIKIEQ